MHLSHRGIKTRRAMEDSGKSSGLDIELIVQRAVQEYMHQDTTRKEPAYKAELQEERRRREQLEKRLNEVVAENKRNRQIASEAEFRHSSRAATSRSFKSRLGIQSGPGRNLSIRRWPSRCKDRRRRSTG